VNGEVIKRRRHDSTRRERIERTLLAMRARGLIGKPGVMVALARHFGVTRQHIWQIGVDAGILGKGARPSGSGAAAEEHPPDDSDLERDQAI
jgi:hypothetical protein